LEKASRAFLHKAALKYESAVESIVKLCAKFRWMTVYSRFVIVPRLMSQPLIPGSWRI
jgi:hypothetical protein